LIRVTNVTLVAPNTHFNRGKILIIMKTLLVIPTALLLALSVVPAWAKSDNGNGNGQVKGAPAFLCSSLAGGIYWIVQREKGQANSSKDR
jgi:hypothetical protein